MEADFIGYATKAGLKCSDGRTINADAFKHMDGMRVPLVWQHGHNDSNNILGHVILKAANDGMISHGFFNSTPQGKNAKILVQHEDINALSIFANELVERAKQVFHGMIREVSLVLAGANPGAKIDPVSIRHSDGDEIDLEDAYIIHTGLPLEFDPEGDEEDDDEELEHATEDMTIQEVWDSFDEVEQGVVQFMIGKALEGGDSAAHSDKETEGSLTHKEGNGTVTRNVFEQQNGDNKGEKHTLTHDAMAGIFTSAQSLGSMKKAVDEYMLAHGIDDIDVLFPNARNVTGTPEFDKRRTEWVAGVLNGTHHSPFSRVKTLFADITHDEARAKGYIKGSLKKEEFFRVSSRSTTPATIYKKQKLDRDDILDITDFDVVSWMWSEMRLMLEEELARAILIGDGRAVDDVDKIKDPIGASEGAGIRSILNDHELYAATVTINIDDASSSMMEAADAIIDAMRLYKGTGTPVLYTTLPTLTKFLLLRDTTGRRIWRTKAELADELMVSDIVTVEPMEDVTDLVGIIVNLQDFNIGADKGGEIANFDFFDIDYNQFKYLLETRLSGALTKIRSALIIKKTASANVLVTPTMPTFVPSTGIVTIVATTNVVYKNSDTGATLSTGAQTALDPGATLTVRATPAAGYYLANNVDTEWSFTRLHA